MSVQDEHQRFLQVGKQFQDAIARRRWLAFTFNATGTALLVLQAFRYAGPTDLRYALLYLAYAAIPIGTVHVISVGWLAWRRWRSGWFRDQAELDALMAAADARGENPDAIYEAYLAEKESFELAPPPSPPRILTDAEMTQIYVEAAWTTKVALRGGIKDQIFRIGTTGAEEGFFFAPVALFGLHWWALALCMLAWGYLHYPVKNGWLCLVTSGFGVLVGLTVLPHGILTNALGHFTHDYIVVASQRWAERVRGNLGAD